MEDLQHPAPVPGAEAACKSRPHTDYAAWIDGDGREHLITRDMVDAMIAELVSDPGSDHSLQGCGSGFNPRWSPVRYSLSRPHWGE